jgi:aldehyde dehydrogenase (NAD+)
MNPFQDIFDVQKSYFATGVTRTRAWRIDQLDRLAKMLNEHDKRFYEAISKDFKTALQEKVFEVAATLGTIEGAKLQIDEWMKPQEAAIPKFLAQTGHRGVVYREPFGVTLIMGPFNGPLTLLLRPAVAALSAGNTCVLKLIESLPATSDLLRELVPLYFDPRAVVTVSGNRDQITELLKLPFDFIFFTGSTKVGKIVMRAAAENITPVLLELGGQNPALVDETANIADAAKKIVWGAMAWGGQWCSSPGYAYVHQSVAEQFVAACKKAVVDLYGDDPKHNSDYSRVISAREVKRLKSLIEPDKVVSGGDSDEEARYLAPTILYPVRWDDALMEDEIFGPILPVLTYSNFDEAIGEMSSQTAPAGCLYLQPQSGGHKPLYRQPVLWRRRGESNQYPAVR